MALGQSARRAASSSGTTKYGRGSGVPHPVDVHVGSRIRVRRLLLGMNQETLANQLGLTFQQVQKYESGTNRVSASRLPEVAKILGVPISYFFAEVGTLPSSNQPRPMPGRLYQFVMRNCQEHIREPLTSR